MGSSSIPGAAVTIVIVGVVRSMPFLQVRAQTIGIDIITIVDVAVAIAVAMVVAVAVARVVQLQPVLHRRVCRPELRVGMAQLLLHHSRLLQFPRPTRRLVHRPLPLRLRERQLARAPRQLRRQRLRLLRARRGIGGGLPDARLQGGPRPRPRLRLRRRRLRRRLRRLPPPRGLP